MEQFRPGKRVSQSGIYRVNHHSHRLMHEVTLRAQDIFPRCKQCGDHVKFELVRTVNSQGVVPFRDGDILEECQEAEAKAKVQAHKQAG
jgi:hypothetical protein